MSAVSFQLALDELEILIEYLRKKLDGKDLVVFLDGDLAAGKTTLVQRYAGCDGITSPTFSLQNRYGNIYHYDLYTIDSEKFFASGLVYELEKSGQHFIEWGDKRLKSFCSDAGFEIVTIEIKHLGQKREYRIYGA